MQHLDHRCSVLSSWSARAIAPRNITTQSTRSFSSGSPLDIFLKKPESSSISFDKAQDILRNKSYGKDLAATLNLEVFVQDRRDAVKTSGTLHEREIWAFSAKMVAEETLDLPLMIDAAEQLKERLGYAESYFEESSIGAVFGALVSDLISMAAELGTKEDQEAVKRKFVDPYISKPYMFEPSLKRAVEKLEKKDVVMFEQVLPNLSKVSTLEGHRKLESRTGIYTAVAKAAASSPEVLTVLGSRNLMLNMRSVVSFAEKANVGVDPELLGAAKEVFLNPLLIRDLSEGLNLAIYARKAREDYEGDFVKGQLVKP